MRSWTVLGLSGPSWGRLGAVLGPSWGHLGPSWGRLGAVLGLLGQLGTQDRPKRAQESPKTILSPFWEHFGAPNCHFSGSFLGSCFGLVFGHFLDQFWSHFVFLDQFQGFPSPFQLDLAETAWDNKHGPPRFVIPVRFGVFRALFSQIWPKRPGITNLAHPGLLSQFVLGFSKPFSARFGRNALG